MFADSFLPNLALFLAGQAAAWYCLRSGRPWIGGVVMAVLWIAADWALVARYAYDVRGGDLTVPLAVLQGTAVGVSVWLAVALWRRRWSQTARQRDALFAAAQALDLAGERAQADAGFRRLLRCDPWDAAAWVALGNVLRGAGQSARAARCYRRARLVDRSGEYTELCELYRRELTARAAPKPRTPKTGAPKTGAPKADAPKTDAASGALRSPAPAPAAPASHPARS